MGSSRPFQLVLLIAAACNDASAPRSSLSVAPLTLQLIAGDTARLTTSDVRATIRWRSANPPIATVDRGGLVTAIASGEASVWAIRGSDSAAASVRVIGIKCAGSPQISPVNASLAVGDTVQAFAKSGCTAIMGEATWDSSNPDVAVVVSRGSEGSAASAVISARRAGQAVITARSAIDSSISVAMAVAVR